MSPRGHRILSGVSIAALLGLHLDFWNASRAEPFLLGWIPWDVAYHLAWMAAATAVVFHLTARVWTGRRPPGEAARLLAGGTEHGAIRRERRRRRTGIERKRRHDSRRPGASGGTIRGGRA